MELLEVDDVILDNGLFLPGFEVGSVDIFRGPLEDLDPGPLRYETAQMDHRH